MTSIAAETAAETAIATAATPVTETETTQKVGAATTEGGWCGGLVGG